MSATIFLARHGTHAEVGHILSGRSEIALDQRGRAEAAALADRLAGVPLDAVQSSPRRRATETADAVAGPRGLAVEIVLALDEIDFGGWAGRAFAELDGDPAWQRWNAARGQAATAAGDTMAAVVARVRAHLAALTGRVLCVTHCDVIRGLVADWTGIGVGRMLELDCAPASLTTVEIDAAAVRIVAVGERPRG